MLRILILRSLSLVWTVDSSGYAEQMKSRNFSQKKIVSTWGWIELESGGEGGVKDGTPTLVCTTGWVVISFQEPGS